MVGHHPHATLHTLLGGQGSSMGGGRRMRRMHSSRMKAAAQELSDGHRRLALPHVVLELFIPLAPLHAPLLHPANNRYRAAQG